MPVTLTPLGNTLDVTIVDENFSSIEDLFNSGLVSDDITGTFDKFVIRRWTGGQLVSVSSVARTTPFLNEESQGMGVLDAIYRYGIDQSPLTAPISGLDSLAAGGNDECKDWSVLGSEILGRPGPSFIFQWQEDGISETTVSSSVNNNWPPSFWQPSPGPEDWCFSPWLTIPEASIRVWVPYKAVARITCSARGSFSHSVVGKITWIGDLFPFHINSLDTQKVFRDRMPVRFGIVVDTNPELYDDEFDNSNPNIDSATVSWKVLEDKTFYCSQRQSIMLEEEVAIKGGRFYNFRMVFRDAAIRGCMTLDAGSDTWWCSGTWWDTNGGLGNFPSLNASWSGEVGRGTLSGFPHAPGLVLWEIASVHVEFSYGRSEANVYYSGDSEFGSWA